jgi:hypothetical protein
MNRHFNEAVLAQATDALNRSWEFLGPAPAGYLRTLSLEYMHALDGFRTPASLKSEEFRRIDDMINHMTSPDMYTGLNLREPEAMKGLMKLKLAAGKLHEAALPPCGIYDAPACKR